jgi:hypothetical protein
MNETHIATYLCRHALTRDTIIRLVYKVIKRIRTWNAKGILSSGRELALLSLLNDNNINLGIITETVIPTSSHRDFNVEGYHTFLPVTHSDKLKTAKYRVMVVVRSELAALRKIRHDLMHSAVQSIWIEVNLENRFLVGGLYREWYDFPRSTRPLTGSRTR